MNLIELSDRLKSLPDDYLATQMQRPDGEFPPYLVMTELQNRTRTRKSAQAEQAGQQPATSVAQELLMQNAQQLPENQGIAQLPQAQQMPQFAGGGIVALNMGGMPAGLHDAVRQVESGNRDFYADGSPVVSPKGAMYANQTMPATAADPGYGVAPARNQSPDEFNRVGAEYLEAMLARYGSADKAVAAYNMGPGRLDRLLAQYGENWLDHAPEETRNYVPNVLAQTQAMMGAQAQPAHAGLGALAQSGGIEAPEIPGAPQGGGAFSPPGRSEDPAGGMLAAMLQAIQAQETGGQYDVAQMREGGQTRNFKEWWEAQQDEGVSGGRLFGRALRTGADSLGRAVGEDAGKIFPSASRAVREGRAHSEQGDSARAVGRGIAVPFLGVKDLWDHAGAYGPTLNDLGSTAMDVGEGFIGAPNRASVPEAAAAEPSPAPDEAPDGAGPIPPPPAQPDGAGPIPPPPPPAPMATPAAEPDPNVEVSDLYDQVFGSGAKPRTPEEIRAAQEAFLAADPEQAKRDMWMALARGGFSAAAGTSPNMMANLSQGAMSGLDALQQSQAEQRRQKSMQDLLAYQESRGDRAHAQDMAQAEFAYATKGSGMSLEDQLKMAGLRVDLARLSLDQRKALADNPNVPILAARAAKGDVRSQQELESLMETLAVTVYRVPN